MTSNTKNGLVRWASGLIDHTARAEGPPPGTLGKFMRWCLGGSWRAIGLSSFVNALSGVTEVIVFGILGVLVDATVVGDRVHFWSDNWALVLGGFILMMLVRPMIFGFAGLLQSVGLGPNLFNLTLGRLHRHTIGQAVSFFDNDFAGRIAQKQMQTARALTEIVVELINAGAFAVASLIATGALVGAFNPILTLILIGWVVAYAFYMRFFMPKVRARSADRAAARATVTGQVVDTITNIKTVKLFAQSTHEDRAALGAMEKFRKSAIHWGSMATLFRFGLITLAGALPTLLVGAAIYLWTKGEVTAGALTTVGAMSVRLSQMSGWVSWTLLGVYGNLGEVEDGMKTLSPAHSLQDRDGAMDVDRLAPEVWFKDVSFAYGARTGGVRHVNLRIKAGEKIGLVGASGAGKSTLTSLLLRLHDTEEGRVLIGGHDVRDLTQESLRRQIGLVTQETEMFNRSARENILYGRPDANEQELIEATRKAQADEFIHELSDNFGNKGLDARLGERGVKLSGGQRQRIALARALLKDAPILVLDEATSALDSEVEAKIQSALDAAMEGKTVIAIAHRLSTLASMDRIVVLDRGEIVEEGSHEELLGTNGLYARYWNRQSGGFIDPDQP